MNDYLEVRIAVAVTDADSACIPLDVEAPARTRAGLWTSFPSCLTSLLMCCDPRVGMRVYS
jgi:hypothetical protein